MTAGNTAIGTVASFNGVEPERVAFTPDGLKAYVTNSSSHTVSVIDTQSGAQLKSIALPESNPANLAVSPDGSKVYVLNGGSSSIFIIDTKTDGLGKPSTVQNYTGTYPYGIAFNPAKGSKLAYVTNNDAAASVSVIDTSADSQTGTVTGYAGDQGAHGVAFAPDGKTAYVATAKSVVAIDVASGAQQQPITGYSGITPLNIAFTPDGGKAYVTNQNSQSVSVIDTQTNTQTGVVGKFTGSFPAVVAVTPDGATAYVTCYGTGTVSVIDVKSDTQTATVNLGEFEARQPNGVAFRPDPAANKAGDLAYVVGHGSDSVTIVQVPPAAAVVTSISPSTGTVDGQTSVSISGSDLIDTTGVTFGGSAGTNLKLLSSTQLMVATPPAAGGNPGQVDVTVQNKGGSGELKGGFTYITALAG